MSKGKYILLFLIAQTLDLATTLIGMIFFGMIEVNPFMNQFSLLGMSLIKMSIFLILALIFYIIRDRIPKWAFIIFIVISFTPVITNSLQMILEITGIL